MKTSENKKTLALTLITLIALMSVFGCPQKGTNTNTNGNNNSKPPEKTSSPAPVKTQSKSISIGVDNTGSSSSGNLLQIVDSIKESLVLSENLSFVDVFNIGGDGKQAPEATRQHFEFLVKPVNTFNETNEKAKAKESGCGARKECIKEKVENARKQSESDYQRELAAYNENRKNIVQDIGSAILQSPALSPSCSDIQEQGELVAQSSSDAVIWLTDGQHNCKTAFTGVKFKNKAVLIIVLPIKNEIAGEFKKRFDVMSAKFSNAEVKTITSITKPVMLEFLSR